MARDLYDSFGSVPESAPQGAALPAQSLSTNANMFGANVAEAQIRSGAQKVKSGAQGLAKATEYAAQATEAKTNDWYANEYIPKAAALRGNYDQLEGAAKVHGYKEYMDGLKSLNSEAIGGDLGNYEKELRLNLVQKRQIQETESATRDLVSAQQKLSINAAAAKIRSDEDYGASYYNDPMVRQQSWDSIEGTLRVQAMDRGLNPDNPDHAEAMDQILQEARGNFADKLLTSAISRGDAATANDLYAEYNKSIPGYKQEQIETVLRTENLRQNGVNGAKALMAGEALPQPLGWPAVNVQATVADIFHESGIDPNEGLTVAMIETSMGQNLGTRGDIGQTGKPARNLEEQALNMRDAWVEAKDKARQTLMREPDGWETYAVYQQGVGGGPALLQASIQNPEAKAVDILRPLYKNPKDAISAITNNGGNLTMSSGDFLQILQGKWDRASGAARIDTTKFPVAAVSTPEGMTDVLQPKTATPGAAITAAYSQGGQTVQPSATPQKALENFQAKKAALMQRAYAPGIPESVRDVYLSNLKAEEGMINAAAEAYKAQVFQQAESLQYNETFTSVDEVPSDLKATLQTEFPQKWMDLKLAADKNRGYREDPVATAEIYAKLDTMFEKNKKDGFIPKEGLLDDAARLQQQALDASERGVISADTAKAVIKTLQLNLAQVGANKEESLSLDWRRGFKKPVYENDHYGRAFGDFVKSGADTTEVNRMFQEYVTAADKFKFQDQSDLDQEYFASDDKKQQQPITPEKVISAILTKQAKGKYEGLTMLPTTPNAVIGRDGSSMSMSSAPPQGQADTKINIRAERRKDKSGNEALVYYDSNNNVVKIEEL